MQDDTPPAANATAQTARWPGDADLTLAEPAGPAFLWTPRHVSEHGSEMTSLPLLFWLVAELRPALTVQVGLGNGTCFLGLCQALDTIKNGKLFAFPIGSERLSAGKARLHADLYDDIAQIAGLDEKPSEVAPQLLILSDKVDMAMLEEWLPKLEGNLVIVVRRSPAPEGDALRDTICKLLDRPVRQIALPRKSQVFDLLLLGDALPDRITQMTEDTAAAATTLTLLQRLADGLQQQAMAQKRLMELRNVNGQLETCRAELEDLRRGSSGGPGVIGDDTATTSGALQLAEARLADRERAITRHEQALADFAGRLDEMTREKAEREAALDQCRQEILVLTHLAETAHRTAEEATRELDQAREALSLARDDTGTPAQSLRALLSESQAEIAALRSSTSWRITAPLRSVKSVLNRLRSSR